MEYDAGKILALRAQSAVAVRTALAGRGHAHTQRIHGPSLKQKQKQTGDPCVPGIKQKQKTAFHENMRNNSTNALAGRGVPTR
jgi:hypothetical protein